MSERTRLFRLKDPYDLPASDAQFIRAVRENCAFHYAHCPEYRRVLDSFGFRPEELQTIPDLARLPFLPTVTFKRHRLFSLPRRRMAAVSTSSGTSGRFSEIGFDFPALWCDWNMLWKIGRTRGFFSPKPTHYIILGYQFRLDNRAAVARTAFGATLLAPALSRTYALRYENGSYVPDLDGVAEALLRHGQSRFPTRLVGFPSYTYFLLRQLERRGVRLQLPRGSKLMLGGGWKQFYTQQVDKPVLYDLVNRVLGIPEEQIIEVFSAVEHPILYADCVRHHFHVPVYSRVIIRDPETLEPLPPGQPGLVEFITPLLTATPILAVMTDDLGILHPAGSCPCGNPAPWLEILGRVGLKDIKTCAAGAAELLSGGEGT